MSGSSRTPAPPSSLSRTRGAVLASLLAVVAGAGVSGGLIAAAEADPDSSTGKSVSAIVPQADPRSLSGEAYLAAAAGTCLTWTTGAGESIQSFAAVDCAAPHRVEVARRLDLPGQPGIGPDAPFPTPEQRATIGREQCAPAVAQYAGGRPVDPAGRFVATVVPPSEEGWSRGDHSMLCGVAAVELDGRPAESTGRFAESDQHRLWEPGTCLGFTAARLPGAPVPCANDHSVEIVDRVDVTGLFPAGDRVPTPQEQAALTADACLRAGSAYLGGSEALRRSTLISTLVVPISQLSWETGSRRIDCGLMKAQPQGGFVTLRGPARSGVLLDGAAPVAPTTTTVPSPPAPTTVPSPPDQAPPQEVPSSDRASLPSANVVPLPERSESAPLPADAPPAALAPVPPPPPLFGIPGLPALPPPP